MAQFPIRRDLIRSTRTTDDPLARGRRRVSAGKENKKVTTVYAHDDGASTKVSIDVLDFDPRQVTARAGDAVRDAKGG